MTTQLKNTHFKTKTAAFAASDDGVIYAGARWKSGRIKSWITKVRITSETGADKRRDAIARCSLELYKLRDADSPTGYDVTKREHVARLQDQYNALQKGMK